ncbi:MAG: hypothetical protein ACOVP7_02830 [Lacibacter sp.]
MKKLLTSAFLLISLYSTAQETLTFNDGTSIDVVGADLTVEKIRKLNIGFVAGLDGLTDMRFFNINYLQPKKFYAGMHLGYASLTGEGIFFFSGKDIIKRKRIPLKQLATGYNSATVYVTDVDLEKRVDWGAYVAVSDYGTLFNMFKGEPGFDGDAYTHGFSKLTVLYAGIAKTGYWGYNVVMENGTSQSHYLGRTVLAPFVVLKGTAADYANEENLPSYGLRFSYELTRSSKWFNFGAKLGADGFMRKGKDVNNTYANFAVAPIIAVGLGLSF